MTVDDSEILKIIWEAKLPLVFSVCDEDVYTSEKVNPAYMLVSRMSYLPLLTDKLKSQFSKYVNITDSTKIWFSFKNSPLKSHYPIGLLYDLCQESRDNLPWQVTVNFQNFPVEELIDTTKESRIESHFVYTIKEADYLKSRGQVIQSFQQREMDTLWLGLKNDSYEQFNSINRKLMDPDKVATAGNSDCHKGSGEAVSAALSGSSGFKSLPIRVYRPGCAGFIQKPLKAANEKGERFCVADLPRLIGISVNNDDWRVVTHGIEVPHSASLQWMSEYLSYPDNFLHLILIADT